MTMKVHHLNCGTMCPVGGRLLSGKGSVFSRGLLICHCLLIETELSGLVLVDTGFGLDDIASPAQRLGSSRFMLSAKMDPLEAAATQVEALGFRREDVRHIVLTHLDLDHAGGLSDFPDATVHLLGAEKAAAENPSGMEKTRYRATQWAHGPTWSTYTPSGEPWKGFEAVRSLEGLPPEILMIPLAGHTRGHAGIALQQDDHWLLHCGDAYFFRGTIAPKPWAPAGIKFFQRAVAQNFGVMLQNQARLRELAEAHPDVRLVSAHDPVEYEALAG